MVPRAVGLGASQLTFLVATSLATTIAVGAVSAFSIAFSVFQIPIGVIGIPIGVVMLPSLSRELARGEVASYVSLVSRALRLILWVMLPLAGLTIVLRSEVVTLLFGYGKFDQRGVDLTATVLLCLAFALASESLIAVLARAFYASKDTLVPVLAAVLAVAINVTLAIVLVGPMGLAGIGLAIAVGSWAEVLVLLAVLGRRFASFDAGGVLGSGGPAACRGGDRDRRRLGRDERSRARRRSRARPAGPARRDRPGRRAGRAGLPRPEPRLPDRGARHDAPAGRRRRSVEGRRRDRPRGAERRPAARRRG